MESRKDKRFREQNNVLIKDKARALKNVSNGGINAYTHDISLSGAWICSEVDFPVGYVIRIMIEFAGTDQCVEVDGEVIWTQRSEDGQHFDIGVEFLHKFSNTILSLIRHFYGKNVGVPSSVS